MIQTILVPLDGSALAEGALNHASALAHVTGARLELLRVAEVYPRSGLGLVDFGVNGEVGFIDTAERDSWSYLDAVANSLPGGAPVRTLVAMGGDPCTAILHAIDTHGADLVVMATHGRSGLPRLVLGSVAGELVARSHVPVFLVRAAPGDGVALPPRGKGRVLVPLDGSPLAERALPKATDLARALGWRLKLLHVVHPPEGNIRDEDGTVVAYVDQQVLARVSEMDAYLRDLVDHLPGGFSPSLATASVVVGHAAEAISREADGPGRGIVVMATHAREGLSRLWFGSVAGDVLHRTSCPVMLISPTVALAAPTGTAAPTIRAADLLRTPALALPDGAGDKVLHRLSRGDRVRPPRQPSDLGLPLRRTNSPADRRN